MRHAIAVPTVVLVVADEQLAVCGNLECDECLDVHVGTDPREAGGEVEHTVDVDSKLGHCLVSLEGGSDERPSRGLDPEGDVMLLGLDDGLGLELREFGLEGLDFRVLGREHRSPGGLGHLDRHGDLARTALREVVSAVALPDFVIREGILENADQLVSRDGPAGGVDERSSDSPLGASTDGLDEEAVECRIVFGDGKARELELRFDLRTRQMVEDVQHGLSCWFWVWRVAEARSDGRDCVGSDHTLIVLVPRMWALVELVDHDG